MVVGDFGEEAENVTSHHQEPNQCITWGLGCWLGCIYQENGGLELFPKSKSVGTFQENRGIRNRCPYEENVEHSRALFCLQEIHLGSLTFCLPHPPLASVSDTFLSKAF